MERGEEGDDDGEEQFSTPEKQPPAPDAESVLRRSIASVFADQSLTPGKKFARVNAMRGIVQQPKATLSSRVADCPHYKRSCLLLCNVCNEFVTCRLCHEEMDRFKVAKLKCVNCGNEQAPSSSCSNCLVLFATYCCTICNTYDSSPNKSIFHCDGCGICRIGTRETTRHCDKCGMCIVGENVSNHACFENSFKQDCAACLGRLFDSVEACSVLKCGHAMHQSCLVKLYESEYRCPMCKKALGDMTHAWEEMDEQLQASMEAIRDQIPPELLERVVKCMCNDCHFKFDSQFNPFCTYKCAQCGGFNTNPV
jgi:RING finger/CHY zinc finger protein 1